MKMLTVCLDTNIYISAIAFGGKPYQILDLALTRKFYLVTGTTILEEVQRNLIHKLNFTATETTALLQSITEVATIYEPHGAIDYIAHKQENLVLETALLGNVDILVTGDKKDLLPLKVFNGIIIEPPSQFLVRLEQHKSSK